MSALTNTVLFVAPDVAEPECCSNVNLAAGQDRLAHMLIERKLTIEGSWQQKVWSSEGVQVLIS